MQDGCDILDVGQNPLAPERWKSEVDEELSRLLPVVENLRVKPSDRHSLDLILTKLKTARTCLAEGAQVIPMTSGAFAMIQPWQAR